MSDTLDSIARGGSASDFSLLYPDRNRSMLVVPTLSGTAAVLGILTQVAALIAYLVRLWRWLQQRKKGAPERVA